MAIGCAGVLHHLDGENVYVPCMAHTHAFSILSRFPLVAPHGNTGPLGIQGVPKFKDHQPGSYHNIKALASAMNCYVIRDLGHAYGRY